MWFAVLIILCTLSTSTLGQAALFPSLPFQWCLPSSTPCKGIASPPGTLAQFLIGNITRNGTEWIWLDMEVLGPYWMGIGFADSGIGGRGKMIGVHGYIDGDFGNGEEIQEWQLGNHMLYVKHPAQSIHDLIRFEFDAVLKQRSIRFLRPKISNDRWDPAINLDGDLCFIWALGDNMTVGAHRPGMSGMFCARELANITAAPSPLPTYAPFVRNNPTNSPTPRPTANPTPKAGNPSRAPSPTPTKRPSFHPSHPPTQQPSVQAGNPTRAPTPRPSDIPTQPPIPAPTGQPTIVGATLRPTQNPTTTTLPPTIVPSISPSQAVLSNGDTTSAGAAAVAQTGLPIWIVPLIVVGTCLCCCFLCVAVYLQHRRRQDLDEQKETRKEARKQASRKLAAARRRQEHDLDKEIEPIDIGFDDDRKEKGETKQPLLQTYADALAGGGGGAGYYGPPSSRSGGGGGLAPAQRLHARPVKKSKFSAFGDDDDF